MNLVVPIFILTLILFSSFTYSFVDINILYFKSLYTGLYLNQRLVLSVIYSILIIVLFGCFYFFANHADRLKAQINRIILFSILATIFAYPAALSFDIFNYMLTAKVTFVYQENPYIVYPIEFLNDPHLAFTRAANKTALYAPFWILLSGIPYFLGFGNFILTLFSFKAFIALFYIGTAYLIRKLDKNAVLFFALNPLVIIESLVSGHNDIVMVFFALLSLYLFFQKKYLFSYVAIIGSMLVKFATVFLTPVYLGMLKDIVVGKKINQERAFRYSAIFMFIIFLLTPLREELYPWYAIWFIVFTAFLHRNKFLQSLVLVFSLGLMLRYIPYMATGNYFGPTPIIRNLLMITPVFILLVFTWLKKYSPLR